MHGVVYEIRECSLADIHGHLPVLGHDFAVDHGACDAYVIQIAEEDDVGALSRSDAAKLVIHPEACRRIDRDVLYSLYRVEAFFYRKAYDVIEMSLADKRVRMSVIRDQAGKTVFHIVIEYRADNNRHVMPGTAVAHQCVHPVAHLLEHILGTRRFVAASDARCDVSVESRACFRYGKVTGDDLICL